MLFFAFNTRFVASCFCIAIADTLGNNIQAFKSEIVQAPGVKSGTIGSFFLYLIPPVIHYNISRDAVSNASNNFNVQYCNIDCDYLGKMGMKLVKGRNFSRDFASDYTAVIINETTARILGDQYGYDWM